MAELKTKESDASVDEFLESIEDEQKRGDAKKLRTLMEEVTGTPAKMWGGNIIGFDTYHYKYASGREGDWMVTGFSPRKNNLTLYLMDSYEFDAHKDSLAKLGKYKTGKSCLYIGSLADVDMVVLRGLITNSVKRIKTGKFLS